ncbi:MAG: PilZ domain-containing protein [Candidatus Omnitrophota bacterium]
MSAWEGMNRRQFPRVNYPCMLTVNIKDHDQPFLTHTENLGVGGVCVMHSRKFPMFSEVGLEIDLMDFEGHIQCRGKIVWLVRRRAENDDKPLMYDIGIEFIDIKTADRARIEAVVQRMVKAGAERAV